MRAYRRYDGKSPHSWPQHWTEVLQLLNSHENGSLYLLGRWLGTAQCQDGKNPNPCSELNPSGTAYNKSLYWLNISCHQISVRWIVFKEVSSKYAFGNCTLNSHSSLCRNAIAVITIDFHLVTSFSKISCCLWTDTSYHTFASTEYFGFCFCLCRDAVSQLRADFHLVLVKLIVVF